MRKKIELPEVEPVSLKPIMGIRPGVIILSAMIIFILLLAFLLFVLPGIVQKGGYVRFVTNTNNTAIYSEDGEYIGSSEGSVYYLPYGESTFRFSIYGADAGSVTYDIPHRIFFTLFSHRVDEIEYSIANTPEIEKAAKARFAQDIAEWSKVIDYDDSYHYPPLFTSFAENATALGFESIEDELLYGALHITSDAMEEDFRNAVSILSSSSVRYLSDELGAIIEKKADPVPAEASRSVAAPVHDGSFYAYPEMTITIGSNDSTAFPEANERMVDVAMPSFEIASRPVSEYEYALFVEANPYWSRSNKSTLIANGDADDGYLDGITLTTRVRSSMPIRNVSYKAALAYVEWISERDGVSYMIPAEAEWTAAALSASYKPYAAALLPADSDSSTPSFMMGQLWEMTSTPYIPLSRVYGYGRSIELGKQFPFDDIIVKGGSYINRAEDMTVDTVGAFDASSTSEYVTFRVGIER